MRKFKLTDYPLRTLKVRIFVYEHITGGGLAMSRAAAEAPESLRAEGAAMYEAVAADLAGAHDVELVSGLRSFDESVAAADAVLLIAPETGGVLRSLARRVERTPAALLSPGSEFCAWAADKTAVCETLRAAGVPMPAGVPLPPHAPWPIDFPFPAVLKPNDGCGSQSVRLLPSPTPRELAPGVDEEHAGFFRLERFVPGVAVSVALMRGPSGAWPLPGCRQRLSDDGTYAYLGGECPLPAQWDERARRLALRAAAAMPECCGYVGLDLVLGRAPDGSEDYLIEVNPRLTTSYVGLRALAAGNLAQAMLDVAAGREPRLTFRPGCAAFDADGTVRYSDSAAAANLAPSCG